VNRSPIEWLAKFNPDGTIAEQGYTVNPIRASPRSNPHRSGHFCVKTSTGCRFCYSSKLQKRFGLPEFGEQASYKIMIEGKHVLGPEDGPILDVFLDESKLLGILKHKKPCRLFPFDMSDLFGEWVPDEWIARYFAVATLTPHITHLILTKRSQRMRKFMKLEYQCALQHSWILPDWMAKVIPEKMRPEYQMRWENAQWPLKNVHVGVSIENQKAANERMEDLVNTAAHRRFISYEPALERVDFRLERYRGLIHQIIVGGESGPDARPFDLAWARDAIRQCREAGAAPFFKQAGSNAYYERDVGTAKGGTLAPLVTHSKGGNLDEIPFEDLRIREYAA
jgi:protein gp37